MKSPVRTLRSRLFFCWVVLLALVLAGCQVPASGTAVPATTAPVSAATATNAPEPTATIELPRVVLVVPADGKGVQVAPVEAGLNELAGKDGLQVEKRADVQAGDITPAWKVVVFVQPPVNLDQLLQAAPQTQFVVISAQAVPQKAANLSTLLIRREEEAFLAGYISELVTDDWRAGGLLPDDASSGARIQEAFLNGGRYFCGRCVPLNPPVALFPLSAALPNGSDANAWKAAVDEMQKKILDVVYVSAEASSPEVLSYLAGQKYRLVGSNPPPPDAASQWVATVQIDPAASLQSIWPDLMAGKGGKQLTARVGVTDVQSQWLTPGRQRLVTELQDKLEKGLVGALVAP
jgi:hypothetical protein